MLPGKMRGQHSAHLALISADNEHGFAPALLAAFDGQGRFRQVEEFGEKSNDRLVGFAVHRRRGQAEFEHVAL